MTPLQVIGDRDTVLAFALGGIAGQAVASAAEARAALEAAVAELRESGGAMHSPMLLLVTAGTAERIRDLLDRVILDPTGPLVLEIPGCGEPVGENPLQRAVGRLLGVRL